MVCLPVQMELFELQIRQSVSIIESPRKFQFNEMCSYDLSVLKMSLQIFHIKISIIQLQIIHIKL